MGDPGTGQRGLRGLDRVRRLILSRLLSQEDRQDYTLDADATQIESGKRDAAFTYQKVKGYMPMLGFLYESSLCLYDEFREGNVSPVDGQLAFYDACRARMPLGKRISRYRADSASYSSDLINRLESDGVCWSITASRDVSVQRSITLISESSWHEPERGCGYEIAETVHSTEKASHAFRLIVKRTFRGQGDLFDSNGRYFYHVVASNWPDDEKSAYDVLLWHNQRGHAENFNKELKIGFGMEQLPCGESFANAVFFRIGVIAYNLFVGFKSLSCPEGWMHHTIATFRWKLIQTAGRIVRHAGQVVLKLAVGAKQRRLFEQIRQKIFVVARSVG